MYIVSSLSLSSSSPSLFSLSLSVPLSLLLSPSPSVSLAVSQVAAAECPPVIPAEDQTHVATGKYNGIVMIACLVDRSIA